MAGVNLQPMRAGGSSAGRKYRFAVRPSGIKRNAMRMALLLLAIAAFPALAQAADCTAPGEPGVDWQRCYLDGKDLSGHDLSGSRLRETSFQRAKLANVNLAGADAYRARFISADMRGARLDGGVFVEADFTKADLAGASLKNVDLGRARFFRASLRGADLTGARMPAAELLNADLSGVRWTDGKRICAEGSIGQCN